MDAINAVWAIFILTTVLSDSSTAGRIRRQSSTPAIVTTAQNISVYEGSDAILPGSVTTLGQGQLNWFFIEHNLQISAGNVLLVTDTSRYSIVQPQDAKYIRWNLQITDVTEHDQGHYQLKLAVPGAAMQSVTHELEVIGGPTKPSSTDVQSVNFTACCIDEGVSNTCLPACDPSSTSIETLNPLVACFNDLDKLMKCFSDGRNHLGCCRRRMVLDSCLDFCTGSPPPLSLNDITCIQNATSIIECFQEGQLLLPSPPTKVSAMAIPNQIVVSWGLPEENKDYVTGYRVFYKPKEDSYYHSTPVLLSTKAQYFLTIDKISTYTVYVTAVNTHGSSEPSYKLVLGTFSSSTTPGQGRDIMKCCKDAGIPDKCRNLLCGTDSLHQLNASTALDCSSHLDKTFQCLADGRNHTGCCQRYNVPSACLQICSGQAPPKTHDFMKCMMQLPVVDGCIEEGLDIIPGPPQQVDLGKVTSRTAEVQWDNPSGKAIPIGYVVRYRIEGDPYMQVSVIGKSADLVGLVPLSSYEVYVFAFSDNGTSLPSAEVNFLTPGDDPLPTRNPNIDRVYNVTECCINQLVYRRCQPICSYENAHIYLTNDSMATCLVQLNTILSCGSDGRNHTRCCQEAGVPSSCYSLCAYDSSTSLGTEQLVCVDHAQEIMQCYSEGILTLPRPPERLTTGKTTDHAIQLMWRPNYRGPIATYYIVQYAEVGTTDWTYKNAYESGYVIQNLTPDTLYQIKVLAANENGTSVADRILRKWTSFPAIPIIPITKPPNTTSNATWVFSWKNRTDCCAKYDMTEVCETHCVAGSFGDSAINCYDDIDKSLACAGDGRDHSSCCKQVGVSDNCLDFCRGRTPTQSFHSSLCFSSMEDITSCFVIGEGILPTPPINFTISKVSASGMILTWQPPEHNPEKVLYNVLYSKQGDEKPTVKQRVRSPFILSGLLADTTYVLTVEAFNDKGSSMHATEQIVVTAQSEGVSINVIASPSSVVDEFTKVSLRCVAWGASDIEIQWYYMNTFLEVGDMLVISSLTRNNEGTYKCIVKSTAAASSKDILISARYLPETQADDEIMRAGFNQIADLKCSFRGHPDTVVWEKNNKPLPIHEAYRRRETIINFSTGLINAQLQIINVNESDFGDYSCNGTNKFGSAIHHLKLINPNAVTATSTLGPAPAVSNVTACCIKGGVSGKCLDACSFDVDLDALISDPSNWNCALSISTIISCAADGRDHRLCCRAKKLDEFCLPFCLGRLPSNIFDTRILNCVSQASDIVACMEEGHDTIPTAPTDVHLSLTDNGISVVWGPPLHNPDKVQYYEIIYEMESLFTPHNITTRTTPSVRSALLRSGVSKSNRYDVWLYAGNHHGVSHSAPKQSILYSTDITPWPPRITLAEVYNGNNIHVKWDKVGTVPIDDYIVNYMNLDTKTSKNTITLSTSIKLENLEPNTNYEITVQSRNQYGLSVKSQPMRAKTESTVSTQTVTTHTSSKPAVSTQTVTTHTSSKPAVSTQTVTTHTSSKPGTPSPLSRVSGPSSGVIAVAVIIPIVVIVIVIIALILIRRKKFGGAMKFGKETDVAFENPSYAVHEPDQVVGLPGPDSIHQPVVQFGYEKMENYPESDYAISHPTNAESDNAKVQPTNADADYTKVQPTNAESNYAKLQPATDVQADNAIGTLTINDSDVNLSFDKNKEVNT